jgi:chromosomal replication initiation ATPase DnaA
VRQQVKAQLRFQMGYGTYDIWIANTDGISVEDAPEAVGTSQTLVVQVLSQYAADWLEMRLKPLVLRTLQGLVGSSLSVRFQTD